MSKAFLTTFLLIAISTAATAQSSSAAQDIPRIVSAARGTVVLLKTFDREGDVVALGSGFRIPSGRFVTNAHVLAGATRVEIYDDKGAILGVAHSADMLSTSVDLAILSAGRIRSPYLTLAHSTPAVGERIIVIGAPEGLTNTVSDGIVSALRKFGSRELLQITAPISAGSSGGPVLNSRGQVVGVSVSVLKEGQNLNFAVPISDLLALVASRPGQFGFPRSVAEVSRGDTHPRIGGRTLAPKTPKLAIGDVVNGWLKPTIEAESGRYVDLYILDGTLQSSVSLSVVSPVFKPFVAIFRLVGDSTVVVATSEQSGTMIANLTASLSDGVRYIVGIGTTDDSREKTGTYTIWVKGGGESKSITSASLPDEDRWVRSGGNNRYVDQFDRTRITASGYGTYRVWRRQTFAEPDTVKSGEVFDVLIAQLEVSCADERSRYLSSTGYLKDNLVWSDATPGRWESEVPETVGEHATRTVCTYIRDHGL
jgi:S1-C subfamily serine protease